MQLSVESTKDGDSLKSSRVKYVWWFTDPIPEHIPKKDENLNLKRYGITIFIAALFTQPSFHGNQP